MNATWVRAVVAVASGLCCGAGLVLSGMSDPRNVLRFLDVLGEWEPRLLFVMASAVAVFGLAYVSVARRRAPLFAPVFSLFPRPRIDVPLVAGAAVFGIGWGISGFCPGPSVVALGSGSLGAVVFVLCFLLGSWAVRLIDESALRGVPDVR